MSSNSSMVGPNTPVIIAAKRTPISTRGGRLASLEVDKLASAAIAAVVAEANQATGQALTFSGVYLGNCMGPGGNLARVSTLGAGLPVTVPAQTIDTQCGSSLTAIISAAAEVSTAATARAAVKSEFVTPAAHLVLAGGAESASTAPTRSVNGVAYARAAFAPSGFPDPEMGEAAQALAQKYAISRAAQDAYAVRSQDLASAFNQSLGFAAELAELPELAKDDAPKAGMQALMPRFPGLYPNLAAPEIAVTAGNSSRNSDGAAMVAMLANSSRPQGVPGLAIVGSVTVGVDPSLPGIAPVKAVQQLLEQANASLDQVVAFEMVEAFAAQTLSVLQGLGLAKIDSHNQLEVDPGVCANGGALALGHPWGASAAVSVVRLFSRLVRSKAPAGSLGIATVAVGGGMGVAALFEVVRE